MSALYALDFDGVICDSAVETSITAWKAGQHIWQDMPENIPAALIDQFRLVRPALETGYEAILIIRLLYTGASAHLLINSYEELLNQLIESENISVKTLKQLFGATRDNWISNNADEWLEMNPLFEGVAIKLAQLDPIHCYIITTKQERFVHQILAANGISIPDEQVFGLERNINKSQVLSMLKSKCPERAILFVEDRLPTLIKIQNDAALSDVTLLLADWGYNTEQDKQAATDLAIERISLKEFSAL